MVRSPDILLFGAWWHSSGSPVPTRSSLMPQVVLCDALGNAVTWNSSAWQFANVTGPALAGISIAPLARIWPNLLVGSRVQPGLRFHLDAHSPKTWQLVVLVSSGRCRACSAGRSFRLANDLVGSHHP